VKVDEAGLKETFNRLDRNGDNNVDINEYKRALKENPMLFEWFDLLNSGVNN
jgi:Ca2+-binding EF-hand superfamily protein